MRKLQMRNAGQPEISSPLNQDGATVGAEFAGDEVEHGGLARAVRADQARDAALVNVE
jgi:hypothetical protein